MKQKFVDVKPSELVILAIHELECSKNENRKCTFTNILKHITRKYNLVPKEIKPVIKIALEEGLKYGVLKRQRRNYSLEEVPEPPLQILALKTEKMSKTKNKNFSPLHSSQKGRRPKFSRYWVQGSKGSGASSNLNLTLTLKDEKLKEIKIEPKDSDSSEEEEGEDYLTDESFNSTTK